MEKLNGNDKCLTSFPEDVVGTQALQSSRQDPRSYVQVRASSTHSCESGAESSGQCSMVIRHQSHSSRSGLYISRGQQDIAFK